MTRQYDEARKLMTRARTVLLDEMHIPRMLLFVSIASSAIELLAGDREAAEQQLRDTLAMALRSGEPEHIAPAAARLALLLGQGGRLDEATELARLSLDRAHPEDVAAHALALTATSLVALSGQGVQIALRLANDADSMAPVEMPNLRADVLCALVDVLTASGDTERAASMSAEALDLYRLKGNLAGIDRRWGD
jgi:ATP/maltotriose-dependent transcriptional regulator MalT